jgi:hypothetical protein
MTFSLNLAQSFQQYFAGQQGRKLHGDFDPEHSLQRNIRQLCGRLPSRRSRVSLTRG